eukprot:gnl/TRDRNA2_/TRDRNA2_41236_c0_seq1.p1 gnl/TRDRNA2_/TRDRNA2_41236_c0~~gnl/TRDRNA2_/TRDRNA2_41236_c0_seq1.p1  ORF type:complete len:162 (-),score=19.81 gnl/TRDRNA2_/TRDRNA2_41236_c0_seq1:45-530(-)
MAQEPNTLLFDSLAHTAKQHMSEFKLQELANLVWALATCGARPLPTLFDPISVLDFVMETVALLDPQLQGRRYQMAMHSLAATGRPEAIEAGLAMISRAEACGLLSKLDEDSCYSFCRTLLEALRAIGHSDGMSHVDGTMERLRLIAFAPLATSHVQCPPR